MITVTVVSLVLQSRPDLVAAWKGAGGETMPAAARVSWSVVAVAGVGLAVVLAALVSPYASAWPDGLEKVAENLGFLHKAAPHAAWNASPLPDYAMPGLKNEKTATALAGIAGTLAVLAAGWGLVFMARRRRGARPAPPGDSPT